MELAQQESEQVQLARDPACPPEVLLWLAKNMANPNYSGIFENPTLPAEAIEHLLINSDSPFQKIDLLGLPNFRYEFISIAIKDSSEYLRAAAAERAPAEFLNHLAEDPEPEVRRAVARNPNTPLELRLKLLHDKHSDVICGVLEGTREYLLDPNPQVAPEIWEEILKTKPKNSEVEIKVAENVPAEFIKKAREWVSVERSHLFLRNVFMPKEWVDEFLQEAKIDQELLLPLIVGHGYMKDEYIPLVVNSKNQQLREQLARKRGLSKEIQKSLVKDKSARVREGLAQNPDADPEILLMLVNDKSVSVLDALQKKTYWDFQSGTSETYVGREKIWEAVIQSANKVKTASKTKSVEGRSQALQSEIIDKKRYEELLQDKSIGIQVSATLRAAELGLISFKDAASFVEKNAPSSTAPKNRWVEARMNEFEAEGKDEYLDLVLELRGDQVIAGKIDVTPGIFTPEQILKISKAHLPVTNWYIGTKVELTSDILDELAETPSYSYEVYGSYDDEPEFGAWLTETNNGFRISYYPQALAAKHPKTRMETLEKLKKSRSKFVRGVLLERPDFVTPDDLKKAAKDKDPYVRGLVAAHEKVPLEILEVLAGDADVEVRNLAASNPLATPEIKTIAALLK